MAEKRQQQEAGCAEGDAIECKLVTVTGGWRCCGCGRVWRCAAGAVRGHGACDRPRVMG